MRKKELWLLTEAVVILSFLPWMIVLAHQVHQVMNDFWIPYPTIHFLYWMARAISGGIPMFCALLVLGIVALRAADNGARADEASTPSPSRPSLAAGWQKMLLLAWGVLPFVIGYALTIATRPILYDRYLIGSLPPLLLLAGRGLSVLRSNRPVLAGAIAIVAACAAPSAYGSVTWYMREDLRALAVPFSEHFRSSDAVVFSSPGVVNTLAYYYREPVPLEFVMWHAKSDPFDRPGVTRLWVFVRDGIEEITGPVMRRIAESYQEQQAFRAYSMTLYLYTRAPPPGETPEATGGDAQRK